MLPFGVLSSSSRVEFIKKKFENSFSEESDAGVSKRANAPSSASNLMQQLKDLNLENKNLNSKSETGFTVSEISKNEGKALVKRSPAFRREKFGCAKSLTEISIKKTEVVNLHRDDLNKSTQKVVFEAKVPHVNKCKEFRRSKTDSNLLRHFSNENCSKEIISKNPKNSEISGLLVLNSKRSNLSVVDKNKLSAQYSVVSKKQFNHNKNEAVNLRFSESIRRALQCPLPKGPPPKKPPRTFCHNSTFNQSDPFSNTNSLSASTDNEIPKLKSKLEKLEKAIKNHGVGTLLHKKKNEFDERENNIARKVESCLVQDVTDTCQSCLPMSQCLNQEQNSTSYKKLSKAKSEFYLETDVTDSEKSNDREKIKCSVGLFDDAARVKILNSEAIYDLPRIGFETFGKCSKYLKESVNAKKAEDLHYMCTDLISQTHKCPDFMSNNDWKKSNEGDTQNRIFLPSPVKQSSSQIYTSDDMKELVNDSGSKFGNKSEKKKEIENSEESELCSSKNSLVSGQNETEKKMVVEEDISPYMVARRKIYVSRISSKLMSQIPCCKFKNKDSYKHLFECCLLVGLTLCESKQNVPYIKSVFPPGTKPPPLIESLCFPDASYWPPVPGNNHSEEQFYSLVVTNENGERKFGYCRRVLPEGGHVCLPLAYCIISPHRAAGFYYKVLEELESRHGSPVVEKFISQLYESEFPGPGERLKLKEILEEATRTSHLDSSLYFSSTLVRRPPDVRLEEKDLIQLLQHLQLPIFLKIFSSLLHERKVLLLSNSLRNLSSCIEALQSILLPFSWQHTYIPVLPAHLIEMCEAPTPYVIGLLKPKNVEKLLTKVNFEDGILVDLDDSKILKSCGDEGSILPPKYIKDLKTALNMANNATDLTSESVRNVLVSDAFIRFFVQACGNYSKFIQNLPDGKKIFQKTEFIKSAPSNATQSFLDWFTETAMFNSFIQERLQGEDEDMPIKLFKRRAIEYSEESIKDSAILLKNYRVINRKVKTLSDKIKDFTTFSK